MSHDHGSTKPYACLFWWESDGSDIHFKSGRCRSTRTGDLFLIGEVYGYNGRPNEGTKESIAEITTKIQAYKISLRMAFSLTPSRCAIARLLIPWLFSLSMVRRRFPEMRRRPRRQPSSRPSAVIPPCR